MVELHVSVAKGGAVTQYYGGVMGPGFYLPYTFSGYTPGFYGGWGGGVLSLPPAGVVRVEQ